MKTERWTECLLGVLLGLAGVLVMIDACMELDWLRVAVGGCLLLAGVLRMVPKKKGRDDNENV